MVGLHKNATTKENIKSTFVVKFLNDYWNKVILSDITEIDYLAHKN